MRLSDHALLSLLHTDRIKQEYKEKEEEEDTTHDTDLL